MDAFVNRYATPLTIGLFAVSAVSGAALFVHWLPGAFHGMHEWLSMVLLVPIGLHVWKNWNGIVAYARRRTLVFPLVASLAVALPFAGSVLTGATGGNPAFRVMSVMAQARVSDLAPVLKTTPDAAIASLKTRGYKAESAEQTLNAIADASGVPATQLLVALTPNR